MAHIAPSKAPHRPINAYRVPAMLRNLSYKLTSAFSPSEASAVKDGNGFTKAAKTEDLFPVTDPAIDGDDCLHDCASCSVKYPRKFDIDETEELYGHVKGFNTHLIVATGKTDWVRDVADEKGSIMEAVDRGTVKPSNGVSLQMSRKTVRETMANEVVLTVHRNSCCRPPTSPSQTTPTTAPRSSCYRRGNSSTMSRLQTYQSSLPASSIPVLQTILHCGCKAPRCLPPPHPRKSLLPDPCPHPIQPRYHRPYPQPHNSRPGHVHTNTSS